MCVWPGGGGGGGGAGAVFVRKGNEKCRARLKPVLNWANVCFAEHSSEYSSNFTSFLS